MGFLGPIQLPLWGACGRLAPGGGLQPLGHEALADALDRRHAHVECLGDDRVRPAWPPLRTVRLEQDTGACLGRGRRPAGADDLLQQPPLLGAQLDPILLVHAASPA
jgi:hypothetical protein